MLLLLSVDEAKAQTSTPLPGFPTASPGATPTPGGGLSTNSVTFDFRVGEAGFSSLFGSQVVALGFQTNNEIMDLKGGYGMIDVSQIVLNYNSNAAFEVGLELCESDCLGDDPIVYFLYDLELAACPAGCEYVYSIPNETIGKIKFSMQSVAVGEPYEDVFVVSSIDVVFERGVFDYDLEADCPILSPEQIDQLDMLYRSRCSRCFAEATPQRSNSIPTVAINTPTVNPSMTTTFDFPVMVSGTPMTRTPIFAVPGGGLYTPTFTPFPTSTPGGSSCLNNGGAGGEGDWLAVAFHTTLPYTGSYVGGQWEGVFAPGTDAKLLRVRRAWDGSEITTIRVYVSYDSTLSSSSNALICGIYINASLGSLDTGTALSPTFSNIHPAADEGYFCDYFNAGGLDGVTSIDIATSAFSNGSDGHTIIESIEICGLLPGTMTPIPTSTPHPTGVAWIPTPDLESGDCSVISLRDDTPIAEFPTNFTVVDYGCYTIVPEVEITLADPDIIIDGLSICVTWFQLPLITFLGIAATLDWLLIALSVWLIAMLMRI